MRIAPVVVVAAFVLGAAVALACTPTSWSVADLTYNLQQLNQEAQESTVLHLYSTRDGYTSYGQYVTGFRFVCHQTVIAAPQGCSSAISHSKPRRSAIGRKTPGPGPGPCYVRVALAGLDQGGINSVTVAWTTRRAELQRGEPLRIGAGLVWPLRAGGEVVALVYLDRAVPGFPTSHDLAHGRLIAERVRTSRERSVGVRLAREAPLDEEMRRLIDVALRETGGQRQRGRRRARHAQGHGLLLGLEAHSEPGGLPARPSRPAVRPTPYEVQTPVGRVV